MVRNGDVKVVKNSYSQTVRMSEMPKQAPPYCLSQGFAQENTENL